MDNGAIPLGAVSPWGMFHGETWEVTTDATIPFRASCPITLQKKKTKSLRTQRKVCIYSTLNICDGWSFHFSLYTSGFSIRILLCQKVNFSLCSTPKKTEDTKLIQKIQFNLKLCCIFFLFCFVKQFPCVSCFFFFCFFTLAACLTWLLTLNCVNVKMSSVFFSSKSWC